MLGLVSWAELIELAAVQLAHAGVDSAHYEARYIAKFVARTQVLTKATAQQVHTFQQLLAQRMQRKPLQHICGIMHFRYLTLCAAPSALVVRPETEMLVEYALQAHDQLKAQRGRTLRVADICTGSGAIAFSLATERTLQYMWAVELSADALLLAGKNLQILRQEKQFSNGLLPQYFSIQIADATGTGRNEWGSYDLVVSNPPYVPINEMPVQPEALADPVRALTDGSQDGLGLPKKIMLNAYRLINAGGVFLMEHSPSQQDALYALATAIGFEQIKFYTDMVGRIRFLSAYKPKVSDENKERNSCDSI